MRQMRQLTMGPTMTTQWYVIKVKKTGSSPKRRIADNKIVYIYHAQKNMKIATEIGGEANNKKKYIYTARGV